MKATNYILKEKSLRELLYNKSP